MLHKILRVAYTGSSFEVDVIRSDDRFMEVAGGGRDDRLVQCFTRATKQETILSTGFAFGVERLVNMLERVGTFDAVAKLTALWHFARQKGRLISVVDSGQPAHDCLRSASEYVNSSDRGDIYAGDAYRESRPDAYREFRKPRKD